MPDMTMRQAAEWAGVTRATVQKAIASGRLSAPKDDKGQYRINPAELERVYQPKPVAGSVDTKESHAETVELTATRREIDLLREMVEDTRRTLEDVRQDRDKWRDQAETQTRLLTHQQEQTPQQIAPQAPQAAPALAPQGWRAGLGRWLLRGA